MDSYHQIFENNRNWVASKTISDADFFKRLGADQNPEFLYIGCSDSRIPANAVMGLEPGEVFVHRNVGNLVCSTDLNVTTVIEYCVQHLNVKHIVVCGHYNCGGVKAAMQPKDLGILNPWLREIRDVYRLHKEELNAITNEKKRYDRLVELNVEEQCINIIKIASVQQKFEEIGFPVVHGWVFDVNTGLLKDLQLNFEKILRDVQEIYNLRKN